jgi:hypothetical protein
MNYIPLLRCSTKEDFTDFDKLSDLWRWFSWYDATGQLYRHSSGLMSNAVKWRSYLPTNLPKYASINDQLILSNLSSQWKETKKIYKTCLWFRNLQRRPENSR